MQTTRMLMKTIGLMLLACLTMPTAEASTYEGLARFADSLRSMGVKPSMDCEDTQPTAAPTNGLRGFVDYCGNPSLNDCSQQSTCENVAGGFVCICWLGYAGDGKTCEMITTTTATTTTGPTVRPVLKTYSHTSPAQRLSLWQIEAGITKYNTMQGKNAQITQELVDKLNDITQNYSIYQQTAFIAQMIWESVGFTYTEEIAATTGFMSAREHYQDCDAMASGMQDPNNGQFYYGRGYMQLSWCYNYKAYGADRANDPSSQITDPDFFFNNPDKVANEYALDSAAWFFEKYMFDNSGNFGYTTKKVNGSLECAANGDRTIADKRYAVFKAISDTIYMYGCSKRGC